MEGLDPTTWLREHPQAAPGEYFSLPKPLKRRKRRRRRGAVDDLPPPPIEVQQQTPKRFRPSLAEKLAAMEESFIDNSQSAAVLALLDGMLTRKPAAETGILFLTGDSQIGKTRTLAEFSRRHPPSSTDTPHGRVPRLPVLIVPGIAEAWSVRSIYSSIHRQLGWPYREQARVAQMIDGSIEALVDIEVKMLVIDDALSLGRASDRQADDIKAMFAKLIAKRVQIVLVGPHHLAELRRLLGDIPTSHFPMRNFLDDNQDIRYRTLAMIRARLPLPYVPASESRQPKSDMPPGRSIGTAFAIHKTAALLAIAAEAASIGEEHLLAAQAAADWTDSVDGSPVRLPRFESVAAPEPIDQILEEERSRHSAKRVFFTRTYHGTLPVSLEPYENESFPGYVGRLAAANPKFNNHVRCVDLPDEHRYFFSRGDDRSDHIHTVRTIALATNLPAERLIRHAAVAVDATEWDQLWVAFMDRLIDVRAIDRPEVHWCPLCLKDALYHRNIWRLRDLHVCLVHRVLLRSACPQCGLAQASFGIGRPNEVSMDRCRCGMDLSRSEPSPATRLELKRDEGTIKSFMGLPRAPIDLLKAIDTRHSDKISDEIRGYARPEGSPMTSAGRRRYGIFACYFNDRFTPRPRPFGLRP